MKKTYKEHLENLLSLLHTEDGERPPDVDLELKNAGFEPEKVGKKYSSIAKQAMAKSPHNWRNRAPIELENARKSIRTPSLIKKTRSEIIGAISALMTGQGLRVETAYRNLTKQTDEDLESMLRHLEYIASQKSDSNE